MNFPLFNPLASVYYTNEYTISCFPHVISNKPYAIDKDRQTYKKNQQQQRSLLSKNYNAIHSKVKTYIPSRKRARGIGNDGVFIHRKTNTIHDLLDSTHVHNITFSDYF